MDPITSRERLEKSAPETISPVEKHEKPGAAKEIKKRASEVLSAEMTEKVEGAEGVELSEGRVSEVSTEDKAQAPATSGKAHSADQIEAIRAKLLAALPPQDVMIREIRKKLYKSEKVLTKRMNKLQKKAHLNAFHLTIVVAQIRKIKEYFAMLAHATYEIVKHLWLKIVHGV